MKQQMASKSNISKIRPILLSVAKTFLSLFSYREQKKLENILFALTISHAIEEKASKLHPTTF